MTLAQLAHALPQARLQGEGATVFASVSTDSRTLAAGALFVALRGARFDGHDYAAQAQERGAVALLVDRPLDSTLPQLVVPDTLRALGLGAAHWRSRFMLPLIAVTGSNGKTTVTQMIGRILAQAHGEAQRLVTAGNLNNDIGAPLMLWRLAPAHRAAVLELGMNHPGEIRYLAQLVRPTVALVVNAQREHQEFMASVEATAHENGATLAVLPGEGTACFPADDACASIWRTLAGTRRVLDFARSGAAAVTAQYTLRTEGSRLALATPAGAFEVELPVPGEHNVHNALAAAAAALAVGIAPAAIVAGLAGFVPVAGRGVRHRLAGGALLVDDSYNANPDSVRAAIDLLATLPAPRTLVLGDMGEVGAQGPAFHAEVGAYARARGIDTLLALGTASADSARAFDGGRHFSTVEALLAAARDAAAGGGTLLVKGSRVMRMERVVQALAAQQGAPQTMGAH
ncbi:MAG: UDP-N-acetylmuramoyl-tripeptide--D-alanyl-D-alanine ligase [Burkholderiales bacterium]|nr:UDP-N-acetylmuramoyl-tripeptide--D-alanyl-D-alanine ligase [Burkholderiales bacterium]